MESALMPIETYLTTDGSTTLYDTELDAHYRSTNGAVREVRHVFIDGSRILHHLEDVTALVVLEYGFGGATTFTELANLIDARSQERLITLHYHSVEKRPVHPDLVAHLPGVGGELARSALAQSMEDTSRPARVTVSQGSITLTLHLGEWEEIELPDDLAAHAIFHDPFGPAKNPGGWTREVFAKQARHLHPTGRIATYGAASATRKAMCHAGLQIASLPGPGFKREITTAAHTAEVLLQDARATIIPHTRYDISP